MHKIQYIHVREMLDDELSHTGGLTIGFLFCDNKDIVKVAYAKCHADDRFVKETGRNLVIDRLLDSNLLDQYFEVKYIDILNEAKEQISKVIHGKHKNFLNYINTINDLSGSFLNEVLYELVINHINEYLGF